MKEEYKTFVDEQLKDAIIEKTAEKSSSERMFYMLHKPMIKQSASTTKVRIVFDTSARSHSISCSLANTVSECMHTVPQLQPLLWDILIRARISKIYPHIFWR